MINEVKNVVTTLLNKDQNGYITPSEFNILANNVQNEIFRGYFEDINRDSVKQKRGMTTKGYGNLAFNERQRINKFSAIDSSITKTNGEFILPLDLYLLEDDGVSTQDGAVIEEVERGSLNYLRKSISAPTLTYPAYELYGDSMIVSPTEVVDIVMRYIRAPKRPNWTYQTIGTSAMFNMGSPDFQDFELHESEFPNICNRMLSYFGITLREADIVQIAESLKDKITIKDNN
jgi:hypothetical protein